MVAFNAKNQYMGISVKRTYGTWKSQLRFVFAALLISSLTWTQAQSFSPSGFMVAGNGDFSVGQIFAIPAMSAEASSSPGVQQGYVFIYEYEDDRCEGYAYNGYGFSLPATANPVDTLLVKYDPDERDQHGYDSITHLQLWIHLTKHAMDTTIFLADYDDPRFGTASGVQSVIYHTSDFGCDSVVELLVYRLSTIPNDTATALPGQYEVAVTMNTPGIVPTDFYSAGGILTPVGTSTYTGSYPTGETTPVVWVATIADSSATFTNYVTILEPVCDTMHPQDGSGNTYEVVRLIHDCWLKSNLRTRLYADGTEVPDVRQYPGTDLETYGYLYTYDAATGHYVARGDTLQGACPDGWHLPSYEKVVELMSHYEAEDLMATTNWIVPGNNSSGFTMQPGGFYNPAGHVPYERLLVSAYIWAFTPGSSVNYALEIGSACGTMELIPVYGDPGYSVRCLKD